MGAQQVHAGAQRSLVVGLREAVEQDLPEDAVAALVSRTEGWAAGLQLAGLSLRGQSDVVALVASVT